VTYTGDVRRGGPVAIRELADVVIRKVAVGRMDNNAYLLTCRLSGAQLLVDAAGDADTLLDLVRAGNPAGRLDLVLTTHRHADHQGALAAVVAATGAPTAAGADDAAGIAVPTVRPVRHRDVLTVGALMLEVIALRGHTPGSVALVYREPSYGAHLFTGDSLFPGGVGNTDHDPVRFASLLDDVTRRLFDPFDDAAWVYPGHGADTSLGAERPHLPGWRARGW
jgi:glyoxylase-like metal-dependent hydrolase (beta-lactamase superfamily II)